LMHRNMFRRNESCFEIRQKAMKEQLRHDLELFLADNCQSWELGADGIYKRLSPGQNKRICAQEKFLEELASPKLIQN
jgi:polyphosphate kinase